MTAVPPETGASPHDQHERSGDDPTTVATRLAQARAALQRARATLEAALVEVAVAEAALDDYPLEAASAVLTRPTRPRLHRRWRLS
jgi:hypothetical protein